jgi:hypothetical protein
MKPFVLCLCALFGSWSSVAFAEKGDRAPWYIGGGIGNAAIATYKIGGRTHEFRDWVKDSINPFVFHFKAGGTLAPQHLLGVDIGFVISSVSSTDSSNNGNGSSSGSCCDDWDFAATGNRSVTARATAATGTGSELDASIVAAHAMAVYTFYPRAHGFFLRTGIGPASLDRELEGVRRSSTGHAELVGLGYSFWIARRFNIGVNFDLEVQTYTGGDDNVDSAQLAKLFMSVDWY